MTNYHIGTVFIFVFFFMQGCNSVPTTPNSYVTNYTSAGSAYATYKEYEIAIESHPEGAAIEWNNQFLGYAPLVYKYSGDFPWMSSIRVKASPKIAGHCVQIKVLSSNDPLPQRLYFDTSLCPIQ